MGCYVLVPIGPSEGGANPMYRRIPLECPEEMLLESASVDRVKSGKWVVPWSVALWWGGKPELTQLLARQHPSPTRNSQKLNDTHVVLGLMWMGCQERRANIPPLELSAQDLGVIYPLLVADSMLLVGMDPSIEIRAVLCFGIGAETMDSRQEFL